MTRVALSSSPLSFLRGMRGEVVDARVAYPDVLHLEVQDAKGGLWRLATQDASWSPEDVDSVVGRTVEIAQISAADGELQIVLSGPLVLTITPGVREGIDDPPNWELHSPSDVVLEFGPGISWQVRPANRPGAPASIGLTASQRS